jgi:hypothetical protein
MSFSFARIIFKICIFLSCFDFLNSEDVQSVGKVRSNAEGAFQKGNIEESLVLWAKVNKIKIIYLSLIIKYYYFI